MSDFDGTRTISIPSLAFNYVGNRLESIGSQGEMYYRERGAFAPYAGTRWYELFGTPERAANTVLALQICPMSKDECEECPAYDVCFAYYKDGRTVYEMAKWLRGDA